MDIEVSVILPNYNHALYLQQRIESILGQSFSDFELIILDDCSTDNSREIIEVYRSNPHVSHIIYNGVNSGSTFVQWQKGFDLAKGRYIWIAESDDFADKFFLETLVDGLKKDPSAVLAFSGILYVDNEGRELRRSLVGDTIEFFYRGTDFIKDRMLSGNAIVNASSALFVRDVLNMIPDNYKKLKAAGDWLFWIEVARCGNVYENKQHLDYFRQHGNEVTPKARASGLLMKENHIIFRWLIQEDLISASERDHLVAERLLEIIRCKSFFSHEIKKEVYALWKNEVKYPLVCLFGVLFRKLKRRYL